MLPDFAGNGSAPGGEFIALYGYIGGSTVAQLAGNSTTWLVTDAAPGQVDAVRFVGQAGIGDFEFLLS
ncbi:hypothetical protein [Paucibacter sp. DJ2R-2]|uniref:hypothetical protein n=1 Tax=Paucibacter sp. DJ2R-2 TaxID=2893558 RepID=UPI0021E3E581|nr:hypothetical protein [Paucibacter sp. DJ2R-2]MCV2422133.1 hypothetical protein [Paucibacter sp. DJ4R-1]MCV2440283.1 hypothetical protein [Paucibacter sp. DJ2R-2]